MYFFDTYALIEIVEGNPSYSKFIKSNFVMTKLNLIEAHYDSLKRYGVEKSRMVLYKYSQNIVPFDEKIIEEANVFRRTHAKRKMSTADCIGYIYARIHGLIFVTGDKEFESMEGVEFIK